ncbi:MAG TPA: hypothetical protein VMY99_04740 [Nevskiaceae bacterium]|nr:hypothetical protein [Nevskiaceae bacterium]
MTPEVPAQSPETEVVVDFTIDEALLLMRAVDGTFRRQLSKESIADPFELPESGVGLNIATARNVVRKAGDVFERLRSYRDNEGELPSLSPFEAGFVASCLAESAPAYRRLGRSTITAANVWESNGTEPAPDLNDTTIPLPEAAVHMVAEVSTMHDVAASLYGRFVDALAGYPVKITEWPKEEQEVQAKSAKTTVETMLDGELYQHWDLVRGSLAASMQERGVSRLALLVLAPHLLPVSRMANVAVNAVDQPGTVLMQLNANNSEADPMLNATEEQFNSAGIVVDTDLPETMEAFRTMLESYEPPLGYRATGQVGFVLADKLPEGDIRYRVGEMEMDTIGAADELDEEKLAFVTRVHADSHDWTLNTMVMSNGYPDLNGQEA